MKNNPCLKNMLVSAIILAPLLFSHFWWLGIVDYLKIFIIIIGVWFVSLKIKNKCLENDPVFFLYLINFAVLSAVIIISVYIYDKYLDFKLDQFDLNGDGVFSLEEQTPEQKRAMDLVIGDAGRSLVVFTGPIFSFLITLFLFLLVIVNRALKNLWFTYRSKKSV